MAAEGPISAGDRAANDFERACRLIGGGNGDIGAKIAKLTGKRASRWAVMNWRNGVTPVPGWALYAAFDLAGIERVLRIAGGAAQEELVERTVPERRRRRAALHVWPGGLGALVVLFILSAVASTPTLSPAAVRVRLEHAVRYWTTISAPQGPATAERFRAGERVLDSSAGPPPPSQAMPATPTPTPSAHMALAAVAAVGLPVQPGQPPEGVPPGRARRTRAALRRRPDS